MRHRNYFFAKLLATVLMVAVPLLALHAWTLHSQLRTAEEEAYQNVREASASAARIVESTLDSAERLATYVATHQEVQSKDPSRCTQFLRGLETTDLVLAVVSVLGMDGQPICMSVPGPERPPASARGSAWFTEALASDSYYLGKPAIGRITGKPVAPLSLAIKSPDGTNTAIAVVSLDLLRLEALMTSEVTAAGEVLAVIDKDQRFVVRSPDTMKWLGHQSTSAARVVGASSSVGALSTAIGVDGVERIFASTSLARHQLRVVASIPAEQVFARPRAQIRNALVVATAALLLGALLAFYGARALSRPLKILAESARGFARGRKPADRADSLPGEFGVLAAEMNAMHDALVESETKAQRISRINQAVSRTNQAILRLKKPQDLYNAICEICVETGQANMAWIGLQVDDEFTPVAWGGQASRYTQGMDLSLAPESPSSNSLIGTSMRSGQCCVVNDYANDPATGPFRSNASLFGVQAAAVVPLSRAGTAIGTLNLYSDKKGFFDSELVELLSGLGLDISSALDNYDHVAAHDRTVRELAKRENQLSRIVESATDAIVTVDGAFRIIVFNDAASRVFKVPVWQAIGKTLDTFMPERYRASHARHLMAYAQQGSDAEQSTPRRRLTGLRSDGVEFPLVVSSFRTHDENQVLVTLLIRDTTGERDAERARVAAIESNAANLAKTEFLSRMSHELRTPLNAVLGFSQLLQENASSKLNAEEIHQLELVFLAGAQMLALVDDVLDVSIIESGQLSLAVSDFELTGLLDGVMHMSAAVARQGGIKLIRAYSVSAPRRLQTDPSRLRQVMLNLVSNAIKYNRPGGTVEIGVEAGHGRLQIVVSDSGLGMTPEQMQGLFEPFNRLGRENSSIAGTGIGMALVRKLVAMMGGTIVVASEAGIGTVVRVELSMPQTTMHDSLPQAKSSSATEQASAQDPTGLVLYIEDNAVNVLIIRKVLSVWPDVILTVAADGKSGIKLAVEQRPDMVLLDMGLPDMTGLEVLKALKGDALTRDLRVIALSASAMQGDVSAAKDAGALDYWTKPIDAKGFREGVRRLLQAGLPLATQA